MTSKTAGSQDASDLRPAPSTSKLQQPTPDDFFHFELVSFQVENKIFRVPKSGFNTPGSHFQATFLPSRDQPASGVGSNAKPIRLEGIKENHFRAFLQQIYRVKNDPPMVEFDDWVGVLKLSTMCDIKTVRAQAIKALTPLLINKNPLEKVHLGRRYKVSTWIRKGYIELVRNKSLKLHTLTNPPAPLSPLDWETIAKIYHVREVQNADMLSSQEYLCHPCLNDKFSKATYSTQICRTCPRGHEIAYDSSSPSFTPTKTCSESLVETTFSAEFERTRENDE